MPPEVKVSDDGRLLGRYDLHVHTTMSDGDVELAEVVSIAQTLGVTVGIADHVSLRNPELFVSTAARLDHYLRELEAAPVLRSAELCWCDAVAERFVRDRIDRFDYLVGSNHGFKLPDGTMASPWWRTLPGVWAEKPHALMERMVDNIRDLMASMPIAIVAHPTLMPPALLELEADVHAWWTEELEDRVIESAIESGIALEISNRYRLPHDRFLRKAREAGARFSLGSDGHHRHQVAQLGWAVDAALRAGIGDDQLFIPQRA